MNKIKKFKKSKKTNNKRNHKRRRMTRKLRGGTKELEEIFQEHDNETRPINERINQIVSTGELREQITALQRKIEQTEYDLTGIAEILIQGHLLDRDYFNSTRFSQPARKMYTY